MSNKPLYVTKPFLPPLDEFTPYLQEIWDSKVLTNGGKFHTELEFELSKFLGVGNLSLFNNATIGLITAIKALEIKGEVITTPYSFVATSHAILWNSLEPVFVDIDPITLNIDPKKIEVAITDKTTAIMPVHCYGRPCDVHEIERIAKKYSLKVVYDAAHAFDVKLHGESILNFGDLSVVSFHATKVFNTFEGGAIISPTPDTKAKIDQLKNFGFIDEITVNEAGINGKMSEVNSAFGLLQLKYFHHVIKRRKEIDNFYRTELDNIPGLVFMAEAVGYTSNYSYFPILINEGFSISRDDLYNKLKSKNIFTRRYFYPLITQFPMYKSIGSACSDNLPIASVIAQQVLCLPIYPDLTTDDLTRVIKEIRACCG